MVVIIDHTGAKVCAIGDASAEPLHFAHHRERRAHDADRNETYPDDAQFFEKVAEAISESEGIVLISHGKGQSNEADHLRAYLKTHHKDVEAKIVHTLTADLQHLSLPELIHLGREAFT